MFGLLLLLSTLFGPTSPPPVPIAVGPRYQRPAITGRTVAGLPIGSLHCTRRQISAIAHVELFVNRRAVLLAPGIGVAPPRTLRDGVVGDGRCTYPLSTRDPTGVVFGPPDAPATLGQLFRIWGQPLGARRLLGFHSHRPLRAFVDGHRWTGPVTSIPLSRRNEVVVELGGLVPPHSFYLFAEGG